MTKLVALIPARAGSKRVPGKNLRLLDGHPLLAYAIGAAQESGIFDYIYVSSEDHETLLTAERYGANGLRRPRDLAADDSPDIRWVEHALVTIGPVDALAIIRPTSPFRRGAWIRSAWEYLQSWPAMESLRAMRPCSEHPGKMWAVRYGIALPILPWLGADAPWHSMPSQELPSVWLQTAALEISRMRLPFQSISGDLILPWLCAGDAPESIDINTPEDFERAQRLAAEHPAWLPPLGMASRLSAAESQFIEMRALAT